jgi:hypothetical protein
VDDKDSLQCPAAILGAKAGTNQCMTSLSEGTHAKLHLEVIALAAGNSIAVAGK